MAHVTYFNRHANMTPEVMKQVRHFINLCDRFGNVTNWLFGLYDGYLYADLYKEGLKTFPKSEHKNFRNLMATVRSYPKTETDTTVH